MSEIAQPVLATKDTKARVDFKDPQKQVEPPVSGPEKSLPLAEQILGELQQASVERQAREVLVGKEPEVEKPKIINLGKVPAFFVEPPVHLSAKTMIEMVNKARAAGIIISPTEEGRRFVGYFDSPEKLKILQEMGHLSVGLPSEGAPSLIHVDGGRGVEVEGSMTVIAAARGMSDPDRHQSAWKIVHNPTGKSRVGAKGVNIEATNFSDIEFESFPPDLPKETFAPIEIDQITTEYHDAIDKVIVDTNEFGETFRKLAQSGNVDGQIAYVQDQILLYNKIDDRMRKVEDIIGGEEQTDCYRFYLKDISAKVQAQKVLAEVVDEDNVSFKAVGKRVNDVELTKYKGRVIHSTKPTFLPDKEKIVKKALRGKNTEERKKLQSYIYMEPTKIAVDMGFKAA